MTGIRGFKDAPYAAFVSRKIRQFSVPAAKPESCTGVTIGKPTCARLARRLSSLLHPRRNSSSQTTAYLSQSTPHSGTLNRSASSAFIRGQFLTFHPPRAPAHLTAPCRHNCHIASRKCHPPPHQNCLQHNDLQPTFHSHTSQKNRIPYYIPPPHSGPCSALLRYSTLDFALSTLKPEP